MASVILAERKKRECKIWESYLIELRSQLQWIRFATDHESKVNTDKSNQSFEIINDVFAKTKYLLGVKKDNLLAELKYDIDSVKKDIELQYSIFPPDKGYDFEPHERIEYEISNFCKKYSQVDIVQFISEPNWIESISRLNNTYSILHRHYLDMEDDLGLKAIVFTYLPMVISLTSAAIWLLLHLFPLLKS